MIVEFGRWQLRPIDQNNWALATVKQWEGHEASSAKSGKRNKAPSTARYFQWPNIGYAVHYAATRDLMDKEGTATPWEAADELTRTCDALLAECCRALGNYTKPTAKTSVACFPTNDTGNGSTGNG